MVKNCSVESSFSQLKYIKNPLRAFMEQICLSSLFILSIEADLLTKIKSDDIIKDFIKIRK